MNILPVSEKHIQWITKRINLLEVADKTGIAVESDNGKILGVCIMNTWHESSVQLHLAIDNPICLKNYTVLNELFDYIFNTSNRKVAICMVSSDNRKILKFLSRTGFRKAGCIKDGYKSGDDLVIFELHREECIWINQIREAA